MKIIQIIFGVLFSINGCVLSTAPENNTAFSDNTNINDLVGLYKNKGDGGQDIYLSQLLWPNDNTINHTRINKIHVTKLNTNTLSVKALNDSLLIKNDTFIEGKDFFIKNGQVHLATKEKIIGLNKEPAIGFEAETTTLGLDKNGHGKYKSTGGTAILAYLFVPIAVIGTQEVRFHRMK